MRLFINVLVLGAASLLLLQVPQVRRAIERYVPGAKGFLARFAPTREQRVAQDVKEGAKEALGAGF